MLLVYYFSIIIEINKQTEMLHTRVVMQIVKDKIFYNLSHYYMYLINLKFEPIISITMFLLYFFVLFNHF